MELWPKRILGFFALTLFVGTLFVVGNCGKGSGSVSFPAVAPIVAKALPPSLAPASTQAIAISKVQHRPGRLRAVITPTNDPSGEMTNAATYIQSLFQNTYNNSDNGQADQGLLNMLVVTIDGRMASINSQIASTSASCLSNAATPYTIDLSGIDPMLKFTLNNLQCASSFNGNSTGSGVLFGSSGTNYSMQMSLGPLSGSGTFFETGGFFAAANVSNYASTDPANPESVDGMLIAVQPGTSQSPQMWVTRFKASPTTNTFELFFAANEPNIQGATQGTFNGLGGGFRMISDGTHVYADGVMFDPNVGLHGTYSNFNTCLTASTMALDTTVSDCQTLANSFTIAQSPSLNFAEVTGYSLAVVPAGPGSTTGNCLAIDPSAFTSSSTCIAAYGPPSPVALASVFTSLNTFFPISNAGLPSFGH